MDIDMMTSVYAANLCRLVEEGEVDEHLIDECCLRILELKTNWDCLKIHIKMRMPRKRKHTTSARSIVHWRKSSGGILRPAENDGVLPLDTAKRSHLSARIPTIMKSRAAGPSPATARTA